MRTCPNCGGNEFTNLPDAWVCQYCDTRHPKPAPVVQRPVSKPEPAAPRMAEGSHVVPQSYAQRERQKNKWVAFFLCFFLGMLGVHKFYEKKIFMGILYFCTYGLFGIGWIIDCIILLMKPNPYYV